MGFTHGYWYSAPSGLCLLCVELPGVLRRLPLDGARKPRGKNSERQALTPALSQREGVLETHAGRESIGQVPYIASEQRASTTIMP